MNVSLKHFLACALVLALGRSTSAEYDVNAYCTLVKNGVKLGSIDSCQDFYVCMNGVAMKQSCGADQSFDKNGQTCRASSLVACYYGLAQPCAAKQKGYVPDVKHCGGYIYCNNFKEAGRGICPPSTIMQDDQCRYGKCLESSTGEEVATLSSVCDIMPNGRYFGSTVACDVWQMCTADGLKSGECPQEQKFVFDVQNNLCRYETPGMCKRVTFENMQPDEEKHRKCSLSERFLVEASTSICSVYFACDGQNWVKKTCLSGQYFDVRSKSCQTRQKATPIDTCNRCEGTRKQFVNAVDPSCSSYFVCNNGAKSSKASCAANYYFNELSQACVFGDSGLEQYAAANGACAPKI